MSVSPVFGNAIAAFYFEKICEVFIKKYDLGTEKIGQLVSHNIITMLWASLISDLISFIFAIAFIMAETRKITQEPSINIKENAS